MAVANAVVERAGDGPADPDGHHRDGPLRRRRDGYGSDADVMFVHDPHAGRRPAGASSRRSRSPTRYAGCWARRAPTRRSRWTPTCGPRASRARWSGRSRVRRATTPSGRRCGRPRRCCAPSPSSATRTQRQFTRADRPVALARGRLRQNDLVEIRRIKARVEDERMPRGADPATHSSSAAAGSLTSSGPSRSSSSSTPQRYRGCGPQDPRGPGRRGRQRPGPRRRRRDAVRGLGAGPPARNAHGAGARQAVGPAAGSTRGSVLRSRPSSGTGRGRPPRWSTTTNGRPGGRTPWSTGSSGRTDRARW